MKLWINRLVAKILNGTSQGVFRGMVLLALGSVSGRFVGAVSIPILTRLYSPDDFGLLAVFTSLVTIMAPLVTLRYVLALPLPRNDGAAMNLLVLSAFLILVLTVVLAIVLCLAGEVLLSKFSMEVLTPWRWLVALGVSGTASYELLSMWATRRRAYKIIAQTSLTQSVAGALVKITLGCLAIKPLGLLLGQVLAQSGGIGAMLRGFRVEFHKNWRRVRLSRMCKMAWRFRGFPLYRVPSQFLLGFSLQAPQLFCALLFSRETTGQLGLAFMALSLPINLIGQSAGRALYAEAAHRYSGDPVYVSRLAIDVQHRLLAVSIIPAALLYFLGPDLFSLFFGARWREAGAFASTLSISMVFQFTSTPLVQLINLLPSQKIFLFLNFLRAVGLVMIYLSASSLQMTPGEFTLTYSVFMAVFYAFMSGIIIRLIYVRSRA